MIGSSRWIDNSFLRFNGNRDLFLNVLNWLSSDEDLISIRPKEPEDRRLTLSARLKCCAVFYSAQRDLDSAADHRGGRRRVVAAPVTTGSLIGLFTYPRGRFNSTP